MLSLISLEPKLGMAQIDPVDKYYEEAATKIKVLKNRSLDISLSPAERTVAASELRAYYPRATPGLWTVWLEDRSAPELAQVALTDMASRLFSSHYHTDASDGGVHATPDAATNARELLRSLAMNSDQPALRKGALDTLGSFGDPVGLAALKKAVEDKAYDPAMALSHLSAAPKVGAPILADLAADGALSMDVRLGAVRVMKNSPEYSPALQTLALSTNIPAEIRQEALRSNFTVAPNDALQTAVAAISSTKEGANKGELVRVITDNANNLPPDESTDKTLKQLSKDLAAEHGTDRVTNVRLRGLDHAISSVEERTVQQ